MSPALFLWAVASSTVAPLASTSTSALVVERVAGGRHARFESWHGPVHVFLPDGYRRETAAIILYVHGYFTGVDQAMIDHHLLEQFARSKKNALFIVPEAPSKKAEEVFWPSLPALIAEVEKKVDLRRPDGIVVAIGHSGAYRTLFPWLQWRRLDLVVMVDAFYAFEDEMLDWITRAPGADANRLIVVSKETRARADRAEKRFLYGREKAEIPARVSRFSSGERSARFLHLISQYDHMGLVTSGEVLPVLIELVPAPTLR